MSTHYSHILLAADLLDESGAVAERARHLAELEQAKLSIINVVEALPLYFGNELVLPESQEIERQLLQRGEKRMAELCQRLGVPASQGHVVAGLTRQAVLDFAEREGVDLIVVGSRSRHALANLLGSTARAVVNSAKCDVLAVRVAAT